MVDFETIKQALINHGYEDDIAAILAERIFDWGWEDIRDVLNKI